MLIHLASKNRKHLLIIDDEPHILDVDKDVTATTAAAFGRLRGHHLTAFAALIENVLTAGNISLVSDRNWNRRRQRSRLSPSPQPLAWGWGDRFARWPR